MTKALTADVVGSAGKKTDDVELPAEVFGAPLDIPPIYQVVVGQLTVARQGTHTTKARDDVRGGGRKSYHQKGADHARQGSARAPQLVGGGTVHGPQPHDYSRRAPKKMKTATLRNALSDRTRNGHVHIIAEFVTTTMPSTKNALVALRNPANRKALVIVDRQDDLSRLNLHNALEAHVLWADQLNTYGVLKSDDIVFTTSGLDAFLGRGEEEPK